MSNDKIGLYDFAGHGKDMKSAVIRSNTIHYASDLILTFKCFSFCLHAAFLYLMILKSALLVFGVRTAGDFDISSFWV